MTYTGVHEHLLKLFIFNLQAYAQLCLLKLLLTTIQRRPLLAIIMSLSCTQRAEPTSFQLA